MFSDAPLALAKLGMIENVSWFLMAVGLCLMAVGWLWLIYQNYRMSPIQGILSVIPLLAVIFAFYTLEHRQKSIWTSLFVGGIIVGSLGNVLLYSVDLCHEDTRCAAPLQIEEEGIEGDPQEAPAQEAESSL